jgi:hypothetical protein
LLPYGLNDSFHGNADAEIVDSWQEQPITLAAHETPYDVVDHFARVQLAPQNLLT